MALILIIDDDAQICTLLERLLQGEKHEVITAEDGTDGVRIALERKPDLLIVDMYMPGKDGIEVIQEVNEKLGHIPIIAMSGGGVIGSLAPLNVARHLRANVLPKPVRPGVFLAAVREALGEQDSG